VIFMVRFGDETTRCALAVSMGGTIIDLMHHPPRSSDETTLHIRRAVAGDQGSLSWLYDHFSGLLLGQAAYRLAQTPHLRTIVEPQDLVQQTWAVVIPRLADLEARDGRLTPVLVRFLGSTLLRIFTDTLRGRLGRERRNGVPDPDAVLRGVPKEAMSASERAIRSEQAEALFRGISELAEPDREILVLRGLEQAPYALLARKLGASEGALRVRYHTAMKRLAPILTRAIVDELVD
jgi:RNA polymerase sigma factor (sigma-70 family)